MDYALIRVSKILKIENFHILCEMNNGIKKSIDVLECLNDHSHLRGIISLKNWTEFQKVKIGEFGELTWEKVMKIDNLNWNYDISPEFIFYNGVTVN